MKDLGGSLPVENVQALAANNLKQIPHRYIRPDINLNSIDPKTIDDQIPVIDFENLIQNQQSSAHVYEMQNLHKACQEWGFFQLINHGITDDVVEAMKNDVEEFFKLPLDEKMAYAQLPNNLEGYGQAFVISEEQKLDWGDMLFIIPRPISERKMMFWPTKPPTFRDSLEKYSSELLKVALSLVGFMAKNLQVDEEKLINVFSGDAIQGVRMNYYSPCPIADKVLGISPHSDATGLTLLKQVNEVQGLQIRKDGKWIPVKPLSGAFIVNIGDVLEIMSNGKYKSMEHRATINADKERLSIAAFHGPNSTATIGPLPELVEGKEAYYKTLEVEDYHKFVISSKLDGKSSLEMLKLNC